MRTGLELPPFTDTQDLELQMRHVGAYLTRALQQVPVPENVSLRDQMMLTDIRYNVAEALRLAVDYRRRLAERLRVLDRVLDRLAGSPTPAQGSSPQSSQDPLSHGPPGPEKPEKPLTP